MNGNLELLEYVYQTLDMGVYASSKLLNDLEDRDNKIISLIEDVLKEYEDFLKKSEKLLKKYGGRKDKKGNIEKFTSGVGMKMEVMKDNSDSRISDMMIKGFTMGILEMEKKIDKYRESTDKKIVDLASDILEFQQESIEKFKKYL